MVMLENNRNVSTWRRRETFYSFLLLLVLAMTITTVLQSNLSLDSDQERSGSLRTANRERVRSEPNHSNATRFNLAEIQRPANQTIREVLEARSRRLQDGSRTTGKQKVIVILLQIVEGRTLGTKENYETIFNSDEIDETYAPTGSIKTYLYNNSYGQYELEAYVHDWKVSPNSEAECAGPNGQQGAWPGFVNCFEPVLSDLEAKHVDPSDSFDWDDYATGVRGDNTIDNIIILHNGYNAESGVTDPDGTPASERIRSHNKRADSSRWRSLSTGIEVGLYSVNSAYRGNLGEKWPRINGILHHFLQTLGATILYDEDFVGYGCGGYDILSYPVGQRNSAKNPGNVEPFTKMSLGWLTPIEITTSRIYNAGPSFSSQEVYRFSHGYSNDEYILIENKQDVGWDINMWDGGGIVIWYVDETKKLQ
jgi:M6 family metalloprotease-like protein